jgi:hypothetical protein
MIDFIWEVLMGYDISEVTGFSVSDWIGHILCVAIGIGHLLSAGWNASKLPYLLKCETEGKAAFAAGHIIPKSTIPLQGNLLLFVLPHAVLSITIQLLQGVLWIDWNQRPRLCVALFYLVALNSTLVLLLALGKQRHLHHIDATAINVLCIIISTVASYCVWWLRSFLLFGLMSVACGVCCYIDLQACKMCPTWAADEARKKEEREQKKLQREKDKIEMAKRPTTALEFRSGRTVQTNLKGNTMELRSRLGGLSQRSTRSSRPERGEFPEEKELPLA